MDPGKCGMKLLIYSPTSNIAAIEIIRTHTLLNMWLFIHATIKVSPCYLKMPVVIC